MPAVHHAGESALGKHRKIKVVSGELNLKGPGRHGQILNQPVIQRAVILELKRAQRMGNVLERIRLPVRKIVAWINAPLVASTRMSKVSEDRKSVVQGK